MNRYVPIAALGAAFMVAAYFRLHGIGDQSLWFDEINSVVYPHNAGFNDYLTRVRINNPDHVPLYFIANFVWTRFFSTAVIAQRLFSAALDLAGMLLVYRLALYSGRLAAGPLAALFYALSVYHIFTAQAIRPYALVGFLALLGAWQALELLSKPDRKWLVATLFATHSALLWTHLSGVFVIAAQLGVLMFFNLRSKGKLGQWMLCAALLAGETWLASRFLDSVQSIAEPTFERPGAWHVLEYAFCFDQPLVNVELLPGTFFLPGALAPYTAGLRTPVSILLGVCFGASIVAALAFLGRRLTSKDECTPEDHAVAVFAAGALLPLLGVLTVTFLITPLFMPRFAFAGTAFFYLLLAVGIARLRAYLAAPAVALVAAVYLAEAVALHQSAVRTEWKPLSKEVIRHETKGDLVLCKDFSDLTNMISPLILEEYLPGRNIVKVVSVMQGVQFACDYLAVAGHEKNSVWIALYNKYFIPDFAGVEGVMRDAGLEVRRTDFLAMEKLTLFQLRRRADGAALNRDICGLLVQRVSPKNYFDAIAAMGVGPGTPQWKDAICALAIGADLEPVPEPKSAHELHALISPVAMSSPELGYALAERAVAKDPRAPSAQMALGLLRLKKGDMEKARTALAACAKLMEKAPDGDPMIDLMKALGTGDCARIAAAYRRLHALGINEGGRFAWDQPPALRYVVGLLCPEALREATP